MIVVKVICLACCLEGIPIIIRRMFVFPIYLFAAFVTLQVLINKLVP